MLGPGIRLSRAGEATAAAEKTYVAASTRTARALRDLDEQPGEGGANGLSQGVGAVDARMGSLEVTSRHEPRDE